MEPHNTWKKSHKLKKYKEGGKSITFLTYDGTFGAIYKVLGFIHQQFDATFGDEDFLESSKLLFLWFPKVTSPSMVGKPLRSIFSPKDLEGLEKYAMVKQSLSSDAKDKVLTKWQSFADVTPRIHSKVCEQVLGSSN